MCNKWRCFRNTTIYHISFCVTLCIPLLMIMVLHLPTLNFSASDKRKVFYFKVLFFGFWIMMKLLYNEVTKFMWFLERERDSILILRPSPFIDNSMAIHWTEWWTFHPLWCVRHRLLMRHKLFLILFSNQTETRLIGTSTTTLSPPYTSLNSVPEVKFNNWRISRVFF